MIKFPSNTTMFCNFHFPANQIQVPSKQFASLLKSWFNVEEEMVRDDLELHGDNGKAPIFDWSGWRFDTRYEILSLVHGKI